MLLDRAASSVTMAVAVVSVGSAYLCFDYNGKIIDG